MITKDDKDYLVFHCRNGATGGYTVVIKRPTSIAETVAVVNKQITLELGLTKVHPNDQYNKRVGINLATERALPVLLGLEFFDEGVCHYTTPLDKISLLTIFMFNNKIKGISIYDSNVSYSSNYFNNHSGMCGSPKHA